MHTIKLAPVPEASYSNDRATPNSRWKMSYNVAAWLRVPNATKGNIKLILHYRDSSGDYDVIVDTCYLSDTASVLLSGRTDIAVQGVVEDMTVNIMSSSAGIEYTVDELYVQRRDTDILEKQRLDSNFG